MKKMLLAFFLLGLSLMLILSGCGGGGGKKNPRSSSDPPPALSPAAVNLIPNSGFNMNIFGNGEDYLGNWISWPSAPVTELATLELTTEPGFEGNCLYFRANNCGSEEWHQSFGPWRNLGFGNPYIVRLKTGKTYSVSLKVKSSKPGRIMIKLEDPVTFENLGEYRILTSTDVKTYTSIISTINGRDAQFSIKMGNADDCENDGTEFYFDEIQLLEHSSEADHGFNLIPNCYFDSDITSHEESYWGNWVPYYLAPVTGIPTLELATEPGFEGNCLYFRANDCGNEAWHLGFGPWEIYQPIIVRLKPGKAYFISMKVKSNKPGKFKVELADPATFKTYGSYEISSSTEVQKYTTFLTYGNDKNAYLGIQMGNTNGSTVKNDGVEFFFDDIEFLEQ